MSKHPHPLSTDPLKPGARVRIVSGPHGGKEGRVSAIFRRAAEAQSYAHVKGIAGSKWPVVAVPLSWVEVAG